MTAVQLQLLLVLVLILLNAAFAGSEIALISLRPSQLDRLRDRGKRGATPAKLAEDPNEFLATVQIGITLPGFLASATAAVSLAEPLVPLLSPLGGAAGPVAILLVTLVLTFLTLVAGELAPKRIAMARAEGWALLATRPLQLLATLNRPAVWLLGRSTDILVRLAGVDPRALRDEVGDDELREMVLTRSPSPRQAQILEGTFELAERRVRDILVPRPQVTLVDPAADAGAAIAVLQQSGHSRAPLGDDLDRVSGIVHLKDLVGRGGGAGVLSLEDVLEELVGEIYDEFDRDIAAVAVTEDGALLLDGTFPVHDLPDLHVALPEDAAGSYTTVAGLLLARLGHLPAPGEGVDLPGWRLEAVEVRDRAVQRLRLVRIPG
ncbi:MAG: HlyC/CorC family transporter [Euzebyaceae bacterium]|nr:HlyC/CorC family transporter [Euzebyaceae bacterium]